MTPEEFILQWYNASPSVELHTSGSTGTPKTIIAEKRRMEASARITLDFLGLKPGDTALLCMSVDYIAGKMMIVRSIVGGLRLTVVSPSGHPLASVASEFDFAAMVPMQVHNSLADSTERERLAAIRHLIIGGGPIDPVLADAIRGMPNAVWSTYGMTETLSHVALRRLSGADATEWYTPLPGVEVSLASDGCLVVDAPAVCSERLKTNDIAEVSERGFRILGRKDNVICSGGLKIRIEEVESALRGHLMCPYMLTKRPDVKFGEVAVLLYVGSSPSEVKAICERILPPYHRPKAYIPLDSLPLTPTGKPARAEAAAIAAQ